MWQWDRTFCVSCWVNWMALRILIFWKRIKWLCFKETKLIYLNLKSSFYCSLLSMLIAWQRMTGCLLSTLLQHTSGAELCVRSSCLFLHWLVAELEIIKQWGKPGISRFFFWNNMEVQKFLISSNPWSGKVVTFSESSQCHHFMLNNLRCFSNYSSFPHP